MVMLWMRMASARRRRPMPPASGQRFHAAQNLGAVVEEDAVHHAGFEGAPVELAAGLDHQREIALAAQPVDDAAQVGAAAGAIEDQHLRRRAIRAACGARREAAEVVTTSTSPRALRTIFESSGRRSSESRRCAAAGGSAAGRCGR